MLVKVLIEGQQVNLQCDELGIDRRRPLDVSPIRDVSTRYAAAGKRSDIETLVELGRLLYRWLDGEEGWLSEVRSGLTPPFCLEIATPLSPDRESMAILQAPWELLADIEGFLARDAILQFAPVRRLGPRRTAEELDSYRLGVVFMASSPRETLETRHAQLAQPIAELDYEAEETAILAAANQNLDLLVEDSGDPQQLGERLATLQPPPPVLHLSCHGHNSWPRQDGSGSSPVLLMEDENGDACPTTASDLVDALNPFRPRLLFLSACLTAASVDKGDNLPESLACSLIRAGMPGVVGWDGSVADSAATAFAHEMYERLARRQSVAEAASAARRVLLAEAGMETSSPSAAAASSVGTTVVPPKQGSDWHLARVWLGPTGGDAVVKGVAKRSMLPPDHGHKQLLARKRDAKLLVADPAMFVGRRRELQAALRVLRQGDKAGVLLHGMGRLGKSSLAARISNRMRDHKLAILYGSYEPSSVVEALTEALSDSEMARDLIKDRSPDAGRSPEALEYLLVDLLCGPCSQVGQGTPILLLVDDLERILEVEAQTGKGRVRSAERAVMLALLRAFDPARSESRIIITSRFPLELKDGGTDYADRLEMLQLPPFGPSDQRKLQLRQTMRVLSADVRKSRGQGEAISDRIALLPKARELARGNPGLQDLIGERLILNSSVPLTRVEGVLSEMESYLDGGELPTAEDVRAFLQALAVDELLHQAGEGGRELLRAATVLDQPAPVSVFQHAAEALGGDIAGLRNLGLLDPHDRVLCPGEIEFAVNDLAAARLPPLEPAEMTAAAEIIAPALFEALGGTAGQVAWPRDVDLTLTRLGLLAKDTAIVSACASDALAVDTSNQLKAGIGMEAIKLLETANVVPSLRLFAATARALDRIGDGDEARKVLGMAEELLRRDPAIVTNATDVTDLLIEVGNRKMTEGDLSGARATFEQLCALSADDPYGHAVSRGKIADILMASGGYEEALSIRRDEELPVYLSVGDTRGAAIVLGQIGEVHQRRGEYDEALKIYEEEVLPLFVRLGDQRHQAVVRSQIANILDLRGEWEAALRLMYEQLNVYERLGDERSASTAYSRIAAITLKLGDPDQALEIIRQEVLPRCQRIGDIRAAAIAQGQIADILDLRGELDEVLRIREEEELPVYALTKDVRSYSITQGQIARIYTMKGDIAKAVELHNERLAAYRRLRDQDGIANSLSDLAQIEISRGNADVAEAYLREAWPIVQRLERPDAVAVVGRVLGEMLCDAGKVDEGRDILRISLHAHRQINQAGPAAQIEQKLADLDPSSQGDDHV